MCRQNLCQQFSLLLDDKPLVIQRIAVALSDQSRDVRLIEKKFVEPGDLRKHLKIGEILRLKKSVSLFGRISEALKALPQFLVAGITADQVNGVGLKQIP